MLDYRVIEGAAAFAAIRPKFVALFETAFGRPFPAGLWEHFYGAVPCGPTRAITAWHGDELAGSSVLLHQELVDRASGELIPYGFYVAAMVAPEHRHGISTYAALVSRLNDLAKQAGFRFLLAFPNQNSFLPMQRVGRFKLIDTARFVDGDVREGGYLDFLNAQAAKPFFSERMLSWRLSRFSYGLRDGGVYKMHEGRLNLLDQLTPNPGLAFRGIFPFWDSAGPCPYKPIDDYEIRMCVLPIDEKYPTERIKRSALYSDVF